MLSLCRKLSYIELLYTYAQKLLQMGIAVFILALSSNLSIPLPHTPVPLTLTPQIAIILGIVMGKTRGVLAVGLYLICGAIGLPIFALHKQGILHLLGPTGGYLMGYAAAAYILGYLFEYKNKLTPFLLFCWLALGNLIIYFFGVLQLSIWVGLQPVFRLGVAPFVMSDLSKLLIVYAILRRLPLIQNKFGYVELK